MQGCLHSVERWANDRGYEYRFMGDKLLSMVPSWYADKAGDKIPVVTDLARLLWIEENLQEADVAVWLDADVFMWTDFEVNLYGADCVFGQELWLQDDQIEAEGDKPKLKIRKNVHNAYCGFRKHSPTLGFLIHTIKSLVERVDAQYIAPQFVGPKLLTSLNNTVGFHLEPRIGALSPVLQQAIVADNQLTLDLYRRKLPQDLCGANLCLSLVQDDGFMQQLLMQLSKNGLTKK